MKVYAVAGAFFIPMLAAVLVCLNDNGKLVGDKNRNSHITTVMLGVPLMVFLIVSGFELVRVMG